MKILFANDGSVNADQALASILEREWSEGTQCRVVTVAEPLKVPTMLDIGQLAQRAQVSLESDLQVLLRESHQKLETKFGKENATAELVQGNPKLAITETAQKWGADLIVIGSHGTNADESFFGSVTRAVVLDSPCSIQIINAPTAESMGHKQNQKQTVKESRYLVCISEEKNWQGIIDSILQRSWAPESKFQVLTIVPSASGQKKSRFFKAKELTDLEVKVNEAKRASAETLVKEAASKLAAKFSDDAVTHHVLEGSTRNLILQVAQDWPADMIVMGAHEGDKNVMEYFMGSTAAAVAWNALCSVELVKLAQVAVPK